MAKSKLYGYAKTAIYYDNDVLFVDKPAGAFLHTNEKFVSCKSYEIYESEVLTNNIFVNIDIIRYIQYIKD